MTARHRRKGGRYTPRVPRSAVWEMAKIQAALWGCHCSPELETVRHGDEFTYARVLHDDDCPALNRRGYALYWPSNNHH